MEICTISLPSTYNTEKNVAIFAKVCAVENYYSFRLVDTQGAHNIVSLHVSYGGKTTTPPSSISLYELKEVERNLDCDLYLVEYQGGVYIAVSPCPNYGRCIIESNCCVTDIRGAILEPVEILLTDSEFAQLTSKKAQYTGILPDFIKGYIGGLKFISDITSGDLNNIKAQGTYSLRGLFTNLPISDKTYGPLVVLDCGVYLLQILGFANTDDGTHYYMRFQNTWNQTWDAWKEI